LPTAADVGLPAPGEVEPITFAETYMPEYKRLLPVASEAHRAAFAQARTVKLVVRETYDLADQPPEAQTGGSDAAAKVLREAGFEVVAGGATDAEVVVEVWGRPFRVFGMTPLHNTTQCQTEAEARLLVPGLPPVCADWLSAGPPNCAEIRWEPCSSGEMDHGAWSGARRVVVTALLRGLTALMPETAGRFVADDDPDIAWAGAIALGELGDAGVPTVMGALKHDDALAREAAVKVLTTIGPGSVPALAQALEHDRAQVREDAAKALAQIGPQAADAVPALIDALKREPPSKRRHHVAMHVCSKDPDCQSLRVKEALIRALAEIGPGAHPGTPQLAELLDDYDLGAAAKTALARIGGPAAPFLIEALGAETTREHALSALYEIGPDASEAVPALINVLRHSPNQWTRCRAADIVRRAARPGDATAIAALVAALDDPSSSVRIAAAHGLGDMARRNEQAIEALAAARDAEDTPDVAEVMSLDLDTMADDAVERLTSRMLKDRDPRRRHGAAWQLRRLAPKDPSVVPALIEALNDDSESVRGEAAGMLGGFGAESEAARKALLRAVKREANSTCFYSVAAAVAEAGRGGGAVVEPLAEILANGSPRQRRLAARALAYMGPEAEPAVPALVKAIESREMDMRREVALALGEIGDRRAIPALRRALKDEEPDVRRSAGNALGKISGRGPPEGPPDG